MYVYDLISRTNTLEIALWTLHSFVHTYIYCNKLGALTKPEGGAFEPEIVLPSSKPMGRSFNSWITFMYVCTVCTVCMYICMNNVQFIKTCTRMYAYMYNVVMYV